MNAIGNHHLQTRICLRPAQGDELFSLNILEISPNANRKNIISWNSAPLIVSETRMESRNFIQQSRRTKSREKVQEKRDPIVFGITLKRNLSIWLLTLIFSLGILFSILIKIYVYLDCHVLVTSEWVKSIKAFETMLIPPFRGAERWRQSDLRPRFKRSLVSLAPATLTWSNRSFECIEPSIFARSSIFYAINSIGRQRGPAGERQRRTKSV